MSLTKSAVNRQPDSIGDSILTLAENLDGSGKQAQGVAVVDESQNQIGIEANPLYVQGAILASLYDALVTLGTLTHILQVSGSISVSNLPSTQPISASILPLPTGAAQESGNLQTLAGKDFATAANQVTANGSLASMQDALTQQGFGTNNTVDASATVTYVGKEKSDGTWLVMKIDTSSGAVITYATHANNGGTSDYATAWTNRAALTYNTYSVAF